MGPQKGLQSTSACPGYSWRHKVDWVGLERVSQLMEADHPLLGTDKMAFLKPTGNAQTLLDALCLAA